MPGCEDSYKEAVRRQAGGFLDDARDVLEGGVPRATCGVPGGLQLHAKGSRGCRRDDDGGVGCN